MSVLALRTVVMLVLWPVALPSVHAEGSNPETSIKVELVNELDSCLHFDPNGTQLAGLSTKFLLTGTLIQKIGNCGCISRLVTYRVLETISDDQHVVTYERAYGILAAPQEVHDRKRFELTLKSDMDITYTGKVSVNIACKPPD